MGFFNAFKNIILGKPVFTAPQPNQQPGMAPVNPAAPRQGPKVLPPAYFKEIQCRTEGAHMEVEATIHNYAQQELVLDKIRVLGNTIYLNSTSLSPGEEEESTIFDGPRPVQTLNEPCILYYKNEAGDYFASYHTIEYEKMPDNTYKFRNIKFMPPVRDV